MLKEDWVLGTSLSMFKMKIVFFSLLVLLVVLFFHFDLNQYLDPDFFISKKADIDLFYEKSPFLFLFGFFLFYVFCAALSIPGAALLTLIAGFLFNFLIGSLVVSLGSTLGATFSFLLSRFLLKNFVQKKFPHRLKKINKGFEKEGAFYLFSLRLIPVFPFFMVNILMGLTSISTRHFIWASFLGMLPGSLVYVNAGNQLGEIQSPADIISPAILFSFLFLAFLPWIMKFLLKIFPWKRRNRKLKFQKPKKFDFNVIVIGAGSAGLVCSYLASMFKAKVALVEKKKMGGDCLNTGCVPSKALIRSAKILSLQHKAKDFGLKSLSVDYDFQDIMNRVRKIIKQIEPHDSVERYEKLGVQCFSSKAEVLSPYEVLIGNQTYTTKSIVIATGAEPKVFPIPGLDQISYLTSDNLWNLKKLPKKLLVLGGGPIGCELAQCFQRLGSQVTLLELAERLVFALDQKVSETLTHRFHKEGIQILTSHQAERFFIQEGGEKYLTVKDLKGRKKDIPFDEVLLALGRQARVKGFGLEKLNLEMTKQGAIVADPFMATNYPNIFVCGDVAGPYQFTHMAGYQAGVACLNALFYPYTRFLPSGLQKKFLKVHYNVAPWALYTDPEVASAGLNKDQAKEKQVPYETTYYNLEDLDRAVTDNENQGWIEVLTPPNKDSILGVTIVHSRASEMISEFILAMTHKLPLSAILSRIHIYPTLSEGNKYLAGQWRQKHKPEKLFHFLEKFHTWRRG